MNTYSAAVLANLNTKDSKNSVINKSNPESSNDLHNNTELSQANKKLSESKLRMQAMRALPLEIEVELTLAEAKQGAKRRIEVADYHCCVDCVNLKPINRLQCPKCKGVGYVPTKRQVEINLPGGLLPDQKITCEGMGRFDFRSGKNNDLIIKIKLSNDRDLSLKDKDVTSVAAVSLYDMILGADITVPTATGAAPLKLHPFTKIGEIYHLEGLGIAGGDQLVKIKLVMPQQMTGEQMDLFRMMKELTDSPDPGQSSLVFSS